MSSFRTVFASVVLVALAAGYGLSQRAFFTGEYSTYSVLISHSLIRWTALVVLLLTVASALFSRDEVRSET
jgi:hypothetical protein